MLRIDDALRLAPSLAVLVRRTGIASYDFDFRGLLEVSSVMDFAAAGPVVLRVGPIRDYVALANEVAGLGVDLLMSPTAHERVSHLPSWYPLLRDLTPRSLVFESLPSADQVGDVLGWPVFVKGVRQTNRHRASTSVARSPSEFERILGLWGNDEVLHWQNMVCREWVDLAPLGEAVGDVVQPSMEVRTFFFRGEHLASGPYWSDRQWTPSSEQLRSALAVAKEAARLLDVPLVCVDVALDVDGRWWVIECNDAQESGLAGVPPLVLWQSLQRLSQKLDGAEPAPGSHGT